MVNGFLKSVVHYPNHNALFVKDEYYTYLQLWQIVQGVYQQLPTAKKHERIGLYCSEDVLTYATILAINLYGAAYVPLNSKFPVSRNKKIVELCSLDLVLTSVDANDIWELKKETDAVFVNTFEGSPIEFSGNETSIQQQAFQKVDQAIAYILFTSGSTGEPKGVPVSHFNTNSFFNYFLKNYDFNENDRFLQVYELTFDVSVFSFFIPLQVGACCYVLPAKGIKYMQTIEYLQKYKITVVSMVPGVLRYLENYLSQITLPDLRFSFFSGDALYHSLAVKWQLSIPNAKIHNFYGPTETTIVCTRFVFDEKQSAIESVNDIVPLGKAFEGMQTLVVDEDNVPVQKGELCFSGNQVISGYLNNTNEDRFFIHDQKRYYKTGDVVSVNEFGNLVFYGRTDNQVKINGYRIELAEIENAVSGITGARCVAVVNRGANGMNIIIVFIEKKNFDTAPLPQLLSNVLPDYMIPHQFILTEKFALNFNGKIDKQVLLQGLK